MRCLFNLGRKEKILKTERKVEGKRKGKRELLELK